MPAVCVLRPVSIVLSILTLAVSTAHGQWSNPRPNEHPHVARDGDDYVAFFAGASMPDEARVTDIEAFLIPESLDWEWDTGVSASVAVGHYFRSFRLEGEFGFRQNNAQDFIPENTPNLLSEDPDFVVALSLTLNGYYDLEIWRNVGLYVGAGVGPGYVETGGRAFVINQFNQVEEVDFEDGALFLAYQAMAGLSLRLTDGLTLLGGYRYWTGTDASIQDVTLEIPDYHIIEIGLRVDY